MTFLEKSLREYNLHESTIKTIECEQALITLTFDCGFKKKNEPLDNCKIILTVDHMDSNDASSNVYVKRGVQKKRREILDEISLDEFKKLLRKKRLVIDSDYYSELERSMIIFGTIAKYKIVFKVTEIKKVTYVCA